MNHEPPVDMHTPEKPPAQYLQNDWLERLLRIYRFTVLFHFFAAKKNYASLIQRPAAQWRNYVCGALRQDIEWRPHPFPSLFFPSLPSPPNSSTSFPSLSPSLPSLPLEVGPLKSS